MLRSGGVRTIPHRELRNDSARVLEEVRAGAVVQITNHGEVVAVMIPPGRSRYDVLRMAGLIRPPSAPIDFSSLVRVRSDVRSADVIDDLRGE